MKQNNAECNKMSYAYIQHLVFHFVSFVSTMPQYPWLNLRPSAGVGKLIWGSMDPRHTSAWTSPESFFLRLSGILREWLC